MLTNDELARLSECIKELSESVQSLHTEVMLTVNMLYRYKERKRREPQIAKKHFRKTDMSPMCENLLKSQFNKRFTSMYDKLGEMKVSLSDLKWTYQMESATNEANKLFSKFSISTRRCSTENI